MSLNTILSEFHQYWSSLAKTMKFFLSAEKLRNLKYDYLTPQRRYANNADQDQTASSGAVSTLFAIPLDF